jgi:hypothetical protein
MRTGPCRFWQIKGGGGDKLCQPHKLVPTKSFDIPAAQDTTAYLDLLIEELFKMQIYGSMKELFTIKQTNIKYETFFERLI